MHRTVVDMTTASNVLALSELEAAKFVRKCLRDRSLSVVVADLNKELLYGTPREQEDASKALRHIGFM